VPKSWKDDKVVGLSVIRFIRHFSLFYTLFLAAKAGEELNESEAPWSAGGLPPLSVDGGLPTALEPFSE
jgi:hypothetical protein